MTPLIAVLTYNRKNLFRDLLDSLIPTILVDARIVVFDDSSEDGTISWSQLGVEQKKFEFFSCPKRLGVARNSNRALRYFLDHRRYDVLFLLNDDLLIQDTWIFDVYIRAIEKTGFEFFSYTDERSPYKPSAEFTKNGTKLVRRKYGDQCWQVMTRKVVETLGGFDTEFGIFGGENLDFQRRVVAAGFTPDILDVAEAAPMLRVRQYHENVPRALGNEATKHLLLGGEYWLETMNSDPMIWKEIAV